MTRQTQSLRMSYPGAKPTDVETIYSHNMKNSWQVAYDDCLDTQVTSEDYVPVYAHRVQSYMMKDLVVCFVSCRRMNRQRKKKIPTAELALPRTRLHKHARAASKETVCSMDVWIVLGEKHQGQSRSEWIEFELCALHQGSSPWQETQEFRE